MTAALKNVAPKNAERTNASLTNSVEARDVEREPPVLIQGGMGAGVSGWHLASAVAREGHLGVVSGVAVDTLLVRRLQDGDVGGHLRRALAHFPDRAYAESVLARFFLPAGRREEQPYASAGMSSQRTSLATQRLCALGAFAEIWLAKEGHDGTVGINFLEKLLLSNLPAMYGAMLAGVDYVLVGAGIPRDIPGALDALARHEAASCRVALELDGCPGEDVRVDFSPSQVFPNIAATQLVRPRFLAIVASATLAQHLLRHANGRIDGFVVEGPTAGGHNAPPRGALRLSERGEPVYGDRDAPDLRALRALQLPFWLAGSWGTRERVREALELGANGVQVGTAFALCVESGLAPNLREALIEKWVFGPAQAREHVFTDPLASPTHFPFKVAPLAGSLSDPAVYAARERVCDLGYLRAVTRNADGAIAYRCPAEPVEAFVRKGGRAEDTQGRKCLCNALLANVGLAQTRAGGVVEPPLLTAGDDLEGMQRFFGEGRRELHVSELVRQLLD